MGWDILRIQSLSYESREGEHLYTISSVPPTSEPRLDTLLFAPKEPVLNRPIPLASLRSLFLLQTRDLQ